MPRVIRVPFENRVTGRRFAVAVTVPANVFGWWSFKAIKAPPEAQLPKRAVRARVSCGIATGVRFAWSGATARQRETFIQAAASVLAKLQGAGPVRKCFCKFEQAMGVRTGQCR